MKIKNPEIYIHKMHMPGLIALIVLILCINYSSPAFSEGHDNSFYEDKNSNLLVKPFVGFNIMEFNFVCPDDEEKEIIYTARPRALIGVSVSWKMLGLTAGYRLPVTDDEFGHIDNEESLDLRFNYYGRYFGCDLYIQHQKGFFLDEPENHDIPLSDDGTLPYFDSISLNNVSLSLYYIFSWKTFSLRAAFEGTDIQKKSSSSFLLMAGAGELEIKGNDSLLLDEGLPATDRMHGLSSCRYKYISLSPGYGWTRVFSVNYFFNYVIFIGAGLQNSVFNTDSGKFSEWAFFPDLDIRFSIGYTSDRIIYGFSSSAKIHIFTSKDNLETDYIAFNAVFYAGYRFF